MKVIADTDSKTLVSPYSYKDDETYNLSYFQTPQPADNLQNLLLLLYQE